MTKTLQSNKTYFRIFL